MAKLTQEDILAYLDEATILELNELVKAIEEKYGVSAAAPVAAAAPTEAATAAPTTVNVVLAAVGDSKVGVSSLMELLQQSRKTLLLKKLKNSRRSSQMLVQLLNSSNLENNRKHMKSRIMNCSAFRVLERNG